MMISSIGKDKNQNKLHSTHVPTREGFTFIEITLVVVVLGVIAAIALPNFSKSFARLQLQDVSKDLAYLMRYAQSRAITRNREIQLIFNDSLTQYWLLQGPSIVEEIEDEIIEEEEGFDEPEEETSVVEEFQRIPGRLGRTNSVPEKIKVNSPKKLISFYPDGQIDRVRIRVCQKHDCMTVSSQEQRGYIQIFDYAIQ